MLNIIAWLILGTLAGFIAKAIYPGHQGGGIFATIFLGIIGAFVGGSAYNFLARGNIQIAASNSLDLGSILIAVLGSMIAIFLWGLIARRNNV